MIPERLWEGVNEALDAGHDPLEQHALQLWLCEHPEDLAELDHLLDRLAALSRTAGVSATGGDRGLRWSARRVACVVAAVLLAVVWLGVHRRTRSFAPGLASSVTPAGDARTVEATPTAATPTAATAETLGTVIVSSGRGRILSWQITVSRVDATGTIREHSGPLRLATTQRPARTRVRQPIRSFASVWTEPWTPR